MNLGYDRVLGDDEIMGLYTQTGMKNVYVSKDGVCGNRPRCYATVQEGLGAAKNGETVKVTARLLQRKSLVGL